MKTTLKLGLADHGRPFSEDEFLACEFESGYQYELIEGKLYVSYEPDPPASTLEQWLLRRLSGYALEHPEVINHVNNKARVFVPSLQVETIPEPDLAAYRDYPLDRSLQGQLRWEEVSPLLVGEVVSENDPDKDLVRNVRLYLEVPSIREYWILDPRPIPARPVLLVYRRRGPRWQRPVEFAYGETYTTKLLPGFELLIDPSR